MDDRSGEYSILVPQVAYELCGVYAFDAHVCKAARLRRVIRRKYSHALLSFEPPRPSVFQVTQPRSLPLGSYAFVKRQGFGNGVVIGRRVCADLFKLADVVVHTALSAAISGHRFLILDFLT